METSKKPWPLSTIHGIRNRVDTNPDYQRPPVWTRAQKQLLVDTILRNYDVPKLYWRRTGKKPDTYDVIDGQQRLRAIWEFIDGEYALPRNGDPIDEFPIAGLKYVDLPDELRIRLDTYPLDIVLVDDADEDEVREMFLRLQNGTSLRAQEKRNAYPGQMRDFVRNLASHPLFGSVGFSNSRFTYDLVAAQLVCLELASGPANVKNRDLNKMYEDNPSFDEKCQEAKAVRRVLDLLSEVFPDTTPELTRYNVIALYCVAAELLASYVRTEFGPLLHDWFIDFETRRRQQDKLSEDEAEADWVSYKEKISHSTDSEDSIRSRMDFLLRDLLIQHPGLSLKDPQRDFTPQQRLAIFRRDSGACQLRVRCDGARVRWDNWHCDHRVPWAQGGKTTVENGQVSCTDCNLSKGAGT
ncbi:MAG TPA: DUF262 domain-containing protein [Thermoguttaceae bacterium]|nr:DUF262 domain-containing protein [Thermoguttaceae bacterium]